MQALFYKKNEMVSFKLMSMHTVSVTYRVSGRWRFRKILWPSENIWTLTIDIVSPFFYRNMAREHDEIVSCLRRKSLDELTKFTFDTPSFLTAMGPSRDGVLIPADFGLDATIRKSRAHSTSYQASQGPLKIWTKHLPQYHFMKLLLWEDLRSILWVKF